MAQLGDLAQTQTKRDRALRVLAYIFLLSIEPRYTRTLHLAAILTALLDQPKIKNE